MIELAQHIEVLLLENDCVIVPNFGGFVAHYAPAMHLKEDNLFLPPTRTVGFNSQLKLNDGVLVQSYMAAHNTNFSDATRRIEKEVAALTELLYKEGKVELENIGEIQSNIYGSYEFVAYDNKITTPYLYGLDSFEMPELSALQRKEEIRVPANLTKEKKTYEISINRAILRNAVAVAAVIIFFFAFSTPIENTYVEKNNYAQLLPAELFEQIEQLSVAVTSVSMQREVAKPTEKGVTTSQHKTVAVNHPKTSRSIVVKEMKVGRQEAPATVNTVIKTNQADYPFHIIVAGGIGLKDAEEMANQLKAKGFAEAMALNNDGKVRVSILSFVNREEATKQLLELRKNETYKNAWLLAK